MPTALNSKKLNGQKIGCEAIPKFTLLAAQTNRIEEKRQIIEQPLNNKVTYIKKKAIAKTVKATDTINLPYTRAMDRT